MAWLRFSSEGLSLAGYLAAPAGPRPSDHGVVLCHGYPNKGRGAENSGKSFPQLADRLSESLGWPVLTINFRGCAKSEGDFSLDGWQHDIAAAIDEVAALGIAHVWLVGFGTGGVGDGVGAEGVRIRGGRDAGRTDRGGEGCRLLG